MIESSIVTYKDGIVSYSKGWSLEVEFDFLKIWDFYKRLNSENRFVPEYLHFYHVHPRYVSGFSMKDIKCMKALYTSFKFPIYFHIITFEEVEEPVIFNIETFRKFKFDGEDLIEIYDDKPPFIKLTLDQSLILQLLSYST